MTYEINLSTELYGPTVGRYQQDYGPLMTPTSVVISCAAHYGITYYDRQRAVREYTERVRAYFGRVPVLLSPDSLIAYPVDESHCRSARITIERIFRGVDIKTIIDSWADDGWVVLPGGDIVSPDRWDDLKKQMQPQGAVDIYAQVTGIPGGTCQQIVDRYATAYRRVYGKSWHPIINN